MRVCTIEGCGKKHYGRGLCQGHYTASRRADQELHERELELRRTNRARPEVKERERQQDRERYLNNRPVILERKRQQGFRRRADPVIGTEIKMSKKESYARNPERARLAARFHATGFTLELLTTLRREQKGCCAICPATLILGGKQGHSECCDHEERLDDVVVVHGTPGALKVPRGLLCSACNKSLGFYERYQRGVGFKIPQYEDYLACPPVARLRDRSAA